MVEEMHVFGLKDRPQPPRRREEDGVGNGLPSLLSHIGHNPAFRQTVSAFTDALLAADPPIPGLDASVVIPARRMHFTLGVMSLGLDADNPARTIAAAARLLHDLCPRVHDLLRGEKLRVSLDAMDIMTPERGDDERAHVMWVGPGAGGAGIDKFKAVAHLVQKAFQDAGLLVDDKRPLKLHSTVLNTVYRKPRPQQRVPFSYPSVLTSDALRSVLVQNDAAHAAAHDNGKKGPAKINFGTWQVDELQICEMGSWGPEGEYVAAARCSLK
ncbi:kinase A anchor protein [Daedaleopsis nitida]|nr:kinase A anchor protein [Daedaleopsis nitida]